MHTITRTDIEHFSRPQKQPVVSIYIPTSRVSGPDNQQDKIQFKNALSETAKQLESLGVKDQDAANQLKPAQQLVDDDYFWSHQDHGLAVLLGADDYRIYQTSYQFEPVSVVADRYQIKQLLPVLGDTYYYYILQLSPNSVRLLRAKRDRVDELTNLDLPGDITEALGEETDSPHLNFHTGTGGGGAMFHGQKDIDSYKKGELQKFARQIGEKIDRIVGQGPARLVLACAERMESIFRQAYPGKQLHSEHLRGSFDEATAQQLHEQTLPMIETELEAEQRQSLETFWSLRDQDSDLVLTDIHDIARAVHEGQAKSLLVARQPRVWGLLEDGTIPRVEDDYVPGLSDISDALAAEGFRSGREIHVVETDNLPDSPAAAILYP